MIGGRPIRKQRRGENRAEDFETLDFRDEHAESLTSMLHVLSSETEDNTGHGRMTNLRERREIHRVRHLDAQASEVESCPGINDTVVFGGGLRLSVARPQGELP